MRTASLILGTVALAICATSAAAQIKGPCFFLQTNYQGDPMCIAPTQRLPSLGAVIKNKIMSVQIPAGMRVTICDADNFGGSCQTVRESVADFTSIGANGKVASIASEAAAAPPPGPRADTQPPPAPPNLRPGPGQPPQPQPPQPQPPQQQQAKGPPPPPPQGGPPMPPSDMKGARVERDDEYVRELRRLLTGLRQECENGEKTACVRLGFMIGENRVRRAALRELAPELFWWDK
ncbi:MAG: peptidase inhibitor family I36 protein [Alphaproteobacteria bacterium]|nr:peptidase inhibitor family I36 protein [Alphaproteobacteria bacterium]